MGDDRPNETAGRVAVLLVDPASVEAAAVMHELTATGFERVVVGRWTLLVEEVVERAPDLVVIDLAMAGRAGSRLIEMIRAASPERTRIVAITDFDLVDLAAIERGATTVLRAGDLRPFAMLLTQLTSADEPVPPTPVEG